MDDDRRLDILAGALVRSMQKYYDVPENQKGFEEWLAKRKEKEGMAAETAK